MEHIELLCSISELNWVFRDSVSIEEYLAKIVTMTAHHMHTAVCSIYLYDKSADTLVLKATHGLNREGVNKVTLQPGEGITGIAFKELRPICENHSSTHPAYKYFSDLDEERYEAFLAVPIVRGIERVGMMVVQREKGKDFKSNDITVLRAVSNQLANIIENARELFTLREAQGGPADKKAPPVVLKMVKGKTAASGYAFGPIKKVLKTRALDTLLEQARKESFGHDAFLVSVNRTKAQLTKRQQDVEEQLSDVASLIFTAHLMMLQDDLFYGKIVQHIENGNNAAEAIVDAAQHFIALFSQSDNLLFREKADDIRDLALRLIENLPGMEQSRTSYTGHVVIARDMLPSDILVIASEKAAGIILIAGGVTSHLSVLARSLKLPLIIADDPRLLDIDESSNVLLDADTGNVYVNPEESVVAVFAMRNKARTEKNATEGNIARSIFTSDGTEVHILANINLLTDVQEAVRLGCKGVGLYRTEFPFIVRSTFPTEEEQFVIYRKLVVAMGENPVTFRTIDIGGDKILSYYDHLSEQNPFLGLRSIRFALRNHEVFRQQVRAILRAGHGADLHIMFPMISSVEELTSAKAIVTECSAELEKTEETYNAHPRIGMMIEIPAIVEIIDTVATMVDFFSIGTNDFVQYMLAVDRTNEKVASLYLPHHPAVLRALKRVADAAIAAGISVSVCGDMAHQKAYIPFLIGIGIRTLSVDAAYIPGIRECVMKSTVTHAKEIAGAVLKEYSLKKIEGILGIVE